MIAVYVCSVCLTGFPVLLKKLRHQLKLEKKGQEKIWKKLNSKKIPLELLGQTQLQALGK